MRTTHLGLSVQGVLCWPDKELRKALAWLKRDDGQRYRDVRELRHALTEELAQGHKVLPTGAPCEGWSYETGCPGHVAPATRTEGGE